MEQYENHFPLAPSPEGFVGSITLVWISAVTVRMEAVCQTTGPELHGVDFSPLHLLGDGAGQIGYNPMWPELCWHRGRNMFNGDSLSSKQLG